MFRPDGWVDTIYRYYGNVIKHNRTEWTLGDFDVYIYAPDTQTMVRYVGNMQNGFLPKYKTVEVYYPDGSLKEIYSYGDSLGFWWPLNKREFVRSGGLLTQETGYEFYAPWNAWVYTDRTDYVYIGGMNMLTWRYLYDWMSMQWKNHEKDVNSFDNLARLTSQYTYQWDENVGDYLPSHGFSQSYTTNGDIDTLINYVSYDQVSFIPSSRIINEYDAQLNPYRFTIWWYDYTNFHWEPVEMEEFEYQNNITLEQMLWPPFIDSTYMRHQPVKVFNYLWNGQDWEVYQHFQIFYGYREFTGVRNIQPHALIIWPNPCSREVYVDGQGYGVLEINDLSGKGAMSMGLQLPTVVNTEFLPAGVYVYRLQTAKTTHTGKLIRR